MVNARPRPSSCSGSSRPRWSPRWSGELVLQTLFVALLVGFAVQGLGQSGQAILRGVKHFERLVFRVLVDDHVGSSHWRVRRHGRRGRRDRLVCSGRAWVS